VAQRLLLLLYLAGDPPGVAFLLSVNNYSGMFFRAEVKNFWSWISVFC
jgi:hypothetical protein